MFLVILIDMIGIGIVIPVLAALFLSTNLLFAASVPFATRAIVLGFLIAAYPLAQFFGAPILGALSDKHGRKKILFISLVGTIVGYLLFAIGIIFHSLPLLFFSRILDGFTGGNITIAMAAVADVSDQKNKVKRFGLVGMAFGVGMIIGPTIGGLLADPKIVPWFGPVVPFFFAAFLSLVNVILFLFLFKETLHTSRHVKIHVFTALKNIKIAMHHKTLKILFLFAFLFAFGFSFYTQFFQVFLIKKFSVTESDIGLLFGFMGVCIAIAQGFIVRPLSKKFCPQDILPYSTILVSVFIMFMLVPNTLQGIYVLTAIIAIFVGLTMPNMNALISNLTKPEEQGEIMGINQSLQALAMAIPPILAGFFAALHYTLPIIIGSLGIGLAWVVFVFFYKERKNLKCHLK